MASSSPTQNIDPFGLADRGAALGALIGGVIGGVQGGTLGAAGGGVLGTAVGPAGTIVGGVAGAVEGALIGAAVGAAIGAVIGSAVEDIYNAMSDDSKSDKQRRTEQRAAYKDYCRNKPSPTGDECTDMKNYIDYQNTCADMMEQWDNDWSHEKYPGGRHKGEVAKRREYADRKQREYDEKCKDTCD